MFTNSDNTWLIVAFAAIYIPATYLLARYGFATKFWTNAAGMAFFLILSTSWLNYTVSLLSLIFPEWSRTVVGQDIRVGSRFLIAGALVYTTWVMEKARRLGPVAAPPTPSDGIGVGK